MNSASNTANNHIFDADAVCQQLGGAACSRVITHIMEPSYSNNVGATIRAAPYYSEPISSPGISDDLLLTVQNTYRSGKFLR